MPHAPGIGGFVGQMAPASKPPPQFISAGTASVNQGLAATPGKPPGQLAGDLLVIIQQASATPTLPSGFTNIGTAGPVNGSIAMRVSYKFAAADAENLPTLADNGVNSAVALCFRGVNPTTPLDVAAATAIANSLANTLSWPGLTTVSDGVLVVNAGTGQSPNAGSPSVSGWANADLPDLTEVVDAATGAWLLMAGVGTKAVAGAVGATTATLAMTLYRTYITFGLRGL